ncbi:hypothetical protein HY409_02375 [Candidatus Gottesmanbacteria bacterium]|nr:hypothetical protein [Candidatus Gottesmanbacteria bacterium]
MGYFTELNTLLRLPKDSLDTSTLTVGNTYTVVKENERMFPLHIAMLLEGFDGTFFGYCVVHEAVIKEKRTTLTFEVLSLFTPGEQNIYFKRFFEAAAKTGELKK